MSIGCPLSGISSEREIQTYVKEIPRLKRCFFWVEGAKESQDEETMPHFPVEMGVPPSQPVPTKCPVS